MARDGKPWVYGDCVSNGTLRYIAPTTLKKSDPNDGGCLRQFFYSKVLGWKSDEKGFSELGKKCHAEIENFIVTGENTLGPITSAAACYIPPPDIQRARYLIEHDIGEGNLERALLRPEGVPFLGYTDIIRANADIPELGILGSGQAINAEGDGLCDDPPGTIEVKDWKFGAAKHGAPKGDYSLKAAALPTDTQMVTYGLWSIVKTPRSGAPLRLSHVYTNTKGRAESSKETILIPRERLLHRAEYIRSAVRSLKDVARETNAEKIPGNVNACDAFGGCSFRDQCSVYKAHDFATFYGPQEGNISMGVIDNLNIPGFSPSAPAATPVTASPAGVAANLSLGADIASQLAAFGNPSFGAAPAAPPAAPAFTPAQPSKEFVDAVTYIIAKGYGMPPLAGEVAQMFGVLNKHTNITPNYEVPGSGDMGNANMSKVSDVARLIGIAREISPLPNKPHTYPTAPAAPANVAPAGLLSQEAPPSNPVLAADPVPGFGTSPNAMTPNVQVPGLIASVPPTTAAPILAGSDVPAGAPANTTPAGTVEDTKKTSTRKPRTTKPKDGAAASSSNPSTSDDGRWLFINALPQGVPFTDLAPYVHEWAAGMAKHYKCDPADIRMAPKDSPLGYDGKWGALYACARKAAAQLAPGAYYLNTNDSPLNAAASDGFAFARVQNPDGTDGDPVFELVVRGVPR